MHPFPPPQGRYEVIPWDNIDERRKALFEQYEGWLRRRLEDLEEGREARWQRDYSSLAAYERSVAPNRERWRQFLTTWDEPRCDLQAEVEPVADYERFRLDRVWLQVREGLRMDALLFTPHGAPGGQGTGRPTRAGKLPAVVCQHGMNGTPEEACGLAPSADESGYNYCGVRLAEMGFVVVAPHEVGGFGALHAGAHYVGGKPEQPQYGARNFLHRHGVIQGINLMGMDLYHVSRAVDYLTTLPHVDAERLGFYGLSQGGTSALWLPAADMRLKATVSAAFFNHRMPKYVVSGGDHYTAYIDTTEEDRFYWGQMLEFSDWEILSLTCPRAFMVEVGKEDKAAYWPMAQEEFGRAKEVYERLGIGERTELCLHEGGHINRAVESLAFLKKWLMDTPLTAPTRAD
jgi:dienelactone hydrolase